MSVSKVKKRVPCVVGINYSQVKEHITYVEVGVLAKADELKKVVIIPSLKVNKPPNLAIFKTD